ncbi:MAG: universal stress protein [Spirosomataceae bacterium]
MRQTVLVPTDFSNNALIATVYALGLARVLDADVHILHAYSVFTSPFQSQLANETDGRRAKLGAEKSMRDFLEKFIDADHVTITSSIVKMEVPEAISTYASANAISLIVMGTHGTSWPRKDLLGSNTYDVAKQSEVPLLVVPENNKGFKLERVVFFTDYQDDDIHVLNTMKDLIDIEPKSCTLVHIAKNDSEEQKKILTDWAVKLGEASEYKGLDTLLVTNREQLSVVNDTIDQLDADLCLLTLVGGRNFFEKLFHKSLARDIILNPKVPVLLNVASKS